MPFRKHQQRGLSSWRRTPSWERLEARRLFSTYTLTDLADVGARGVVADVNDAGQVAGFSQGRAYRWQDGVATDLGDLGGAVAGVAGMNNLGHVIGAAATAPGGPAVPFLWKDGVMRDLGLGAGAEVVAINDLDQIVGNANGRAFLWRDGAVTDLGELFPGGGATAADINNASVVVGSAYTGRAGTIGLPVIDAFRWQDGVMTDLGTAPFTISSYPGAVNSAGEFAGVATVYVNTGYGAAVLSRSLSYDGASLTTLPVGGVQNWAWDLNDAGQVVGTTDGRAYLYEGGVVKDLNTLLSPGVHPQLTAARAINNPGQIVGSMLNGHSFLLTPDAPAGGDVRVVDDGSPGFSLGGARTAAWAEGYDGHERALAPADRLPGLRRAVASPRFRSTATWSFDGLEAGEYRVSATWTPGLARAGEAPFAVLAGSAQLGTRTVDQRVAPNDRFAGGAAWEDLGTFTVAGGTLSVRLSSAAGGWAVADAVRVERVAAPGAQAVVLPASAAGASRVSPPRRGVLFDAPATELAG